jgi:hypothetical protein
MHWLIQKSAKAFRKPFHKQEPPLSSSDYAAEPAESDPER